MPAAKEREEIRAAVYDRKAEEGIRVVTKRAPKLGRGDVLVRVRACGVNPVDAKFVVADKLPESWRGAARWLVDGRVAGFDLSGVVERAYPGSGFEVGEEVFGAVPPMRGSFADLVAVPSSQLATKPPSLTHAEAAALVLPGLTVVQALRQHGFAPGARVLVIGASGGVGHLAVQVASAYGAGLVVGVCSGRNVEFVKSLGADDVLDYEALKPPDDDETGVRPDPLVERLREVLSAHGGRPFDLVLDTVSSHDARDRAHAYKSRIRSDRALLDHGPNAADEHNYVTIGGRTGGWIVAGVKRVTGVNLFKRGKELFWINFNRCAPDLKTLRALAEGEGSNGGGVRAVKPAIERTVSLTDEGVREAFRMLHGRRVRGKLAIEL